MGSIFFFSLESQNAASGGVTCLYCQRTQKQSGREPGQLEILFLDWTFTGSLMCTQMVLNPGDSSLLAEVVLSQMLQLIHWERGCYRSGLGADVERWPPCFPTNETDLVGTDFPTSPRGILWTDFTCLSPSSLSRFHLLPETEIWRWFTLLIESKLFSHWFPRSFLWEKGGGKCPHGNIPLRTFLRLPT